MREMWAGDRSQELWTKCTAFTSDTAVVIAPLTLTTSTWERYFRNQSALFCENMKFRKNSVGKLLTEIETQSTWLLCCNSGAISLANKVR
jgi:hypothetical protein